MYLVFKAALTSKYAQNALSMFGNVIKSHSSQQHTAVSNTHVNVSSAFKCRLPNVSASSVPVVALGIVITSQ